MRYGERRGLFLDRDGVINVDTGHAHRSDECQFISGIFEMTSGFVTRGFSVIIATNQSGIGRGLYTEEQFHSFMSWMRQQFALHGIEIAAVYHCPFHPTEGIGVYRKVSSWRKPEPGMLLQAAADLGLDLSASWCIGDRQSDIDAARAAGIGHLVRFDPTASAVLPAGDGWVIPRLIDALSLLDTGRAGRRNGERA